MVGVSRVGGDRGNMNDSECECSVCNIFWERVSQGYHGGDFFVNKLLIEEKNGIQTNGVATNRFCCLLRWMQLQFDVYVYAFMGSKK